MTALANDVNRLTIDEQMLFIGIFNTKECVIKIRLNMLEMLG